MILRYDVAIAHAFTMRVSYILVVSLDVMMLCMKKGLELRAACTLYVVMPSVISNMNKQGLAEVNSRRVDEAFIIHASFNVSTGPSPHACCQDLQIHRHRTSSYAHSTLIQLI